MTVDELLNISAGLTRVTDEFEKLTEHKQEAISARTICTLANLIVADLAHYLATGVPSSEALRRAAVGTMTVDGSTATLAKILMSHPTR